jgi:hypothetical protein
VHIFTVLPKIRVGVMIEDAVDVRLIPGLLEFKEDEGDPLMD